MNTVLPAANVSGYERLIPKLSLLDPDDRHVVAATVAAGATVIIIWNLRDADRHRNEWSPRRIDFRRACGNDAQKGV